MLENTHNFFLTLIFDKQKIDKIYKFECCLQVFNSTLLL